MNLELFPTQKAFRKWLEKHHAKAAQPASRRAQRSAGVSPAWPAGVLACAFLKRGGETPPSQPPGRRRSVRHADMDCGSASCRSHCGGEAAAQEAARAATGVAAVQMEAASAG